MTAKEVTIDGNTAVAHVAHATNEVIAIYPITPSSNMGEMADAKSAQKQKNIYGTIPHVIEMQSEGGASGSVHGALTTGALTTTFTASQGLLLMIPNMYKIAGELTPTVFHVSARSLAVQALSIFGDHSDVMATRQTGFAQLVSGSIQEVMDMSLIAQAATLESRIPFLHFFDGFRSSHEIQKIKEISFEQMEEVVDDEAVFAHRKRGLNPENPRIRGTSQNPDVYFQGRETVNKYYYATPDVVKSVMDRFEKVVGRRYHLFDYVGAPDADRVVVLMGSGTEAMHETVEYLQNQGEKVGVLKVHLYRPFSIKDFISTLPQTVQKIAVLDRTKEPGSIGEPLYLDIVSAIEESKRDGSLPMDKAPHVVGGRYGLGSKEFNAGMAKAVLDNLKADQPQNHFTVGIYDDVTNDSLDYDPDFSAEDPDVFTGKFFGLGSDGTVGANKNSVKIIGEQTDNYAQAYFVYDSKKAGSITTSHLRFGKKPIHSTYLIQEAKFLACHNFTFLNKYDIVPHAQKGATFLLEAPYEDPNELWDNIPQEVQQEMIDRELKVYYINARRLAHDIGLGSRTNMIMQTAFFAISGILPKDEAIGYIKDAIRKTYGSKGEKVVSMNIDAVDQTLEHLNELKLPDKTTSSHTKPPVVPNFAPEFVQKVTAKMMAGHGDDLPVSAMPEDGTFITGTTQYEKRGIAVDIPVWEPDVCTQCGECVLVCPHAAIRMKAYDPKYLDDAPDTFKHIPALGKTLKGMEYTIQVAPEDCTGCEICVHECPAFEKDANKEKTGRKALNMEPMLPQLEQERKNYDFFLNTLPETDPSLYKRFTLKGSQFIEPLFEYSGACEGCGETPYVKLMTQLFGDRAIIANATGCSSIYGGNLPTTPYTKRKDGRGPVWSNSLFEDNAEFGLGFRLTADKNMEFARELIQRIAKQDDASGELKSLLLAAHDADQSTQEGVEKQRERLAKIKEELAKRNDKDSKQLLSVADFLIQKSVWIVGGDGWAYDIGYGGLDHVIATGRNVNLLVLDTEVYSNTGGQMSKATPMGAVAQFAANGRPDSKKDLGLMATTYGNVYVAQIAMGYNKVQTVKAFREAEAFNGPSLIIAYSHCIAWGIDMSHGMDAQKLAVDAGHIVLYRYNPELADEGKNPMVLDSKEPSVGMETYLHNENRYRILEKLDPERAKMLAEQHGAHSKVTYNRYKDLSQLSNW